MSVLRDPKIVLSINSHEWSSGGFNSLFSICYRLVMGGLLVKLVTVKGVSGFFYEACPQMF